MTDQRDDEITLEQAAQLSRDPDRKAMPFIWWHDDFKPIMDTGDETMLTAIRRRKSEA